MSKFSVNNDLTFSLFLTQSYLMTEDNLE